MSDTKSKFFFKETWIDVCDSCGKTFSYDDVIVNVNEGTNDYVHKGNVVARYIHSRHDEDESLFCVACLKR